ncbi:DNA repair protein RecO [Thiocapsa sp.]|uniref:DNA repair protein RecO n=1 Tax=Thiocapsa sp. TaxID=2024551 RepID=UPI002D7F9F2B|nr:DNA repair protein RecO [Thiocapsa sp.]
MNARGSLFQAFVLHRREYGNTSLLLEVFAAGRGRFPAIAKGARRARHPTSALLQPFQPLWLDALGRGEVLTLTRVEAAGPAIGLLGRPLLCGFYLNELLVRLLGRDDPHDPLFAFYHAALTGLAGGDDLEGLLRQFEIRLLDELGYAIALDVEADCDRQVVPDGVYVLVPGQGMRQAQADDRTERISGATLLALAQGDRLAPHQLREARALLRRLLEPHLGGRPLKSRELFRRFAVASAPNPGPGSGPGPGTSRDSTPIGITHRSLES